MATKSDDGSFLRIDGQTVVNNGGVHGLQKVSHDIYLEKGAHAIEVLYFEVGGVNILRTIWTPPGEVEQFIPARLLFADKPASADIVIRNIIVRMKSVIQLFWLSLGIAGCIVLVYRKIVRFSLNNRVAILLFGFLLCFNILSIRHRSITYDEATHYRYGSQIVQTGDTTKFIDGVMPFSALTALPGKIVESITSILPGKQADPDALSSASTGY